MRTPVKDSRAAWSYYWSQGNATSLPDLFPRNYSGSLQSFWERAFDRLPPGFRMLDIGTGNGAIALLAREHARRRTLAGSIDAIDRAEIYAACTDPGGGGTARVTFHAGLSVEQMPFAARSFDLVTGQFALEYCDAYRAVPEVRRVLKREGAIAFVVHHAGSPMMRSAAEFADIANAILRPPNIFLRLDRCMRLAAPRSAGEQTRRARALKQLEHSLSAIRHLTLRYPQNSILGALAQRFSDLGQRLLGGVPVTSAEIRELQTRLEFHLRRTQDLLEAGHDQTRLQGLVQLMQETGFADVSFAPLMHEDALLAWELRASGSHT